MLISIIIPTYNVEDYIEECIHAAFTQTYKPIEVICIDNNSTDTTWQKLKQLKKQYPQLIIDKEMTPGAPSARNKGFSVAKGEWIQFLDADDIILPTKLEHQVKKTASDISFIAAASFRQIGDNRTEYQINTTNNIWANLAKVSLGNTCSNLFSRKYIEVVKGWNESLKSSQEYDLMFRMLQQNQNINYDPIALTIINHIPNSITRNSANLINNIYTRIDLLARIRTHVSSISISKKSFKEINQALFDVIRELTIYMPKEGFSSYKRYYSQGFSPIKSQATSLKYIFLHHLFGFKFSHILIRLIKKYNNDAEDPSNFK